MSRRHQSGHRDPTATKVVDAGLPHDLEQALSVLTTADLDMVHYLLENLGKGDTERDYVLIRRLTGRIRVDPHTRGGLLAYLGERVPDGLCLWCGRELATRRPGQRGRRAKYCHPNHRQSACRARARARQEARRPSPTTTRR